MLLNCGDFIGERGRPLGLTPVGLAGARDTLRLRRDSPVQNDIDDTTSPLEQFSPIRCQNSTEPIFLVADTLIAPEPRGLRRFLVGFKDGETTVASSHYHVSKMLNSTLAM